jgi:hypothetical protein
MFSINTQLYDMKKHVNLIEAKWLRVDEQTNAVNYLEMLNNFVYKVDENRFYWKWVMISLHGAMYGFAVSTIRGTNSDSVVITTKNGERLISFDEALRRCQDKFWIQYALLNEVLVLTETQKESIRKMKNLFRNEFIHFKPIGWSIEIHDFIRITLDCLNVIRFLSIQSYSGYRYNLNNQRRVKSLVFQTKKIIKRLDLYKETKLIEESFK